ncbi:yemanuclein isoform X1 [Onthophagus taurus]|uniref:yemanuclein isoform X1 n=1 Tax=Onthophagus taurus TaxID=166361 RepID=UPI0039BDDC9B
MSEVKRPTLSLNSNKVDDRRSSYHVKTVRLHLALPESNEDTYPEYNYKEELTASKKKDKIKCLPSQTNGLDPFNEDDDDVRRIAQEMEAKYGGLSGPKKRRKGRRDDYADIGMGYDESDSFIDNTDGYDEMIPQNVTTVLGGFYINSGELEFKAVDEASSEISSSSSSGDEDEETPKVNGTKRLLSSDSEGEKETENENDLPKKKPRLQINGDLKEIKKKPNSPEKVKEVEKQKEEKKKSSISVKELLKEKKNETNHVREESRLPEKSEKDESKDSMKENKKPLPIDNISDIIEAVVKSAEEKKINEKSSLEIKSGNERTSQIDLDDGESNSNDGIISLENVVKLPENLSNEFLEIIDKLKQLACNSTDGKRKFFSGPVNDHLLKLGRSCRSLGKQTRLKIYEHLAPFLNVKKETLVKKVKNLLLEDDEKKTDTERTTQISLDEDSNSLDGIISLENVVKLPENLPNEIVDIVDKLKSFEKIKFFSGPVNDYLLKLERSCKCLGKQSRLKIYEHLAPFVGVKKDNLIKKSKTLILEDEQQKLKSLLDNLKTNINSTMPVLLQNYERDCQKVLQKKFSRESLTNEENKQLRMPKRKYSWTEDLRQLVKDIVSLRRKCYLSEGKSKDKLESLMLNYLKCDLQPLWPDGWISMAVLSKVCSTVLQTNSNSSNKNVNPSGVGSNLSTNLTSTSDILPSKQIQLLSANSNLSITPIMTTSSPKINDTINLVGVSKSDITINKIENPKISPIGNKIVDELRSSTPSLTITPTTPSTSNNNDNKEKIIEKEEKEIKKIDDLIIIEDTIPPKPKIEMVIDYGKKESTPEKQQIKKTENCQIIDLTEQMKAEEKRRKTQKPKQKYYESIKDEFSKPQISSLEDLHLPQNLSNKHGKNEMVKHEFSRPKSTEGDDIQKVMEDLKVLQKMSSPVKANESLTSSPVSVIAYNKSYSPKSVLNQSGSGGHRTEFKSEFGPGFQDVFQRQLYNEFSLMGNPNVPTPTSSKSHYNTDKYVHSSATGFINDKYYGGSNNNYQQNSNKLKNLPQQSGSCTILDDMFANFLTEYGYPKTGHLPKQQK